MFGNKPNKAKLLSRKINEKECVLHLSKLPIVSQFGIKNIKFELR